MNTAELFVVYAHPCIPATVNKRKCLHSNKMSYKTTMNIKIKGNPSLCFLERSQTHSTN